MSKKIMAVLHKLLGIVTVLLLVGCVFVGILSPRVDFQKPVTEDFEPGYALLADDYGVDENQYVIPTTKGGFLYDTKVGFVYIDPLGVCLEAGDAGYIGDSVELVSEKDIFSSFNLESEVQKSGRVYHIIMYANVLLALLIIVLIDYYNLINKARDKSTSLKKNFEPIRLNSSAVVIVAYVFLILNFYQNGVIDFGEKALTSPSIYYVPYSEGEQPYSAETPLGRIEFGNRQVLIEGEAVPIITDKFVYDGFIKSSINPISSDDTFVQILGGTVLVLTSLFLVSRISQFRVAD